jgi:hypothetical protein
MSNLCLAQLRMNDQSILITRNPSTGSIVCFKTRGAACEYEVFDSEAESDIIEYIIQPMDLERWVLTLD